MEAGWKRDDERRGEEGSKVWERKRGVNQEMRCGRRRIERTRGREGRRGGKQARRMGEKLVRRGDDGGE